MIRIKNGKNTMCNGKTEERYLGFPGDSVVKNFDSWVGKILREGNGNPFQYSRLGNPMDRGAWPATVHRVAVKHKSAIEHARMHYYPQFTTEEARSSAK